MSKRKEPSNERPEKDIADETWHVEEICNGWYIYRDAGWSDKRRCVAEVHHYPSDEGLGCANLIAAAPDLLEALEVAQQFILNGIEYGYINTPEDEDVLAMIKKAVRKAKGIDQ